MKFNILHSVLTSIMLFSASAQATLITEEWTAKVTGVQNIKGISLHETISWLVTYDDNSL